MKKFLCIVMAMCIAFSMATIAFATDINTNSSPITVTKGTLAYNPPAASNGLQATAPPTTYAPSSWYGYNVHHNWTAKSYTWSSYYFTNSDGLYFDCYSTKSFYVEFYYPSGTYISTGYPTLSNGQYALECTMDGSTAGYYVKIVNNSSSSITSSSYYRIWSVR
ncbi:MAG: hypothetical protein Q8876_04525 [Bacillota bacterium]|nr:hypothetical protein [Bacillota bacterium]